MWIAGVAMMVLVCFGGLVGGGFFMHKHSAEKHAQMKATKDPQRQAHEHGDVSGMSEDETKRTHQPMIQTEGSDEGKGIAKESEIEGKK